MKKLLILVIFLLLPLIVVGYLISKNIETNPLTSSAQNLASPKTNTTGANSILIGNLQISWFEVDNPQNLKLIPNYEDLATSKDTIEKYACKKLSSAGFYSKENKPIGLVISDSKKISSWQQNSLLDGILSVNRLLTPRITRNIPQDTLLTAVQSGPIIKENGQFINLRLTSDEEARRVLAGVTGKNTLFFLVIYDPSTQYVGPFLKDVPTILKNFEQQTGIIFADIINLDGGSASAFYAESESLSELTHSGAFFCQF